MTSMGHASRFAIRNPKLAIPSTPLPHLRSLLPCRLPLLHHRLDVLTNGFDLLVHTLRRFNAASYLLDVFSMFTHANSEYSMSSSHGQFGIIPSLKILLVSPASIRQAVI